MVSRFWSKCVVCVAVLLSWTASPTLAVNNVSQVISGNFEKPANTPHATEFGKTVPPLGYVSFCGREEAECKFSGGMPETLTLNQDSWDQISQINHYVNTKIRPASDMELYHVPDYWTYPAAAGDCEDYVLLKKRYLLGLGFNPDVLLITVVLDETHQGHAVLTIPTSRGDIILDNRRSEIMVWNATGYTYLKRQSQQQANQWVSLQKSAPQILVSTKAK